MLQLFALKVAIAVWKASIRFSKKLEPRTWLIFAAMSAAISIAGFNAYSAKSVPDSAIPPIAHAELEPVPLPESHDVLTVELSSPEPYYPVLTEASELLLTEEPFSEESFGIVDIDRSSFIPLSLSNEFPWEFPNRPEREQPTMVELRDSESPDLLTYFEKRVALTVSVITAFLSIVNLFLALQALRTFKAERELKNLQLTHLRLQVEKLQQEIDDARREKEKSTGIILVS